MREPEQLDGVVGGPTIPFEERAAEEQLEGGIVGKTSPEPPGQEREARETEIRSQLTQWSIGLFAATVGLGFIGAFFFAEDWETIKALLDVVIPVQSLLIGGVVGYYFGKGA